MKFPSIYDNFIVPSILSADFSNLSKEIKKVEKYSGWIQVDVMDGHFVKNLSFGPHITSCLRKITDLPIDVHLMVEEPLNFIDSFSKAGANIITVHYESKNFLSALKKIKSFKLKSGIAVKPKTPAYVVKKYLDIVDLVLVMTVEPGFGGQEFIFDMLEKIKELRDFINLNKLPVYLQVDGGINENTILYAINSGANSFVMGSALFREKNPFFIKKMYNFIKKYEKDINS
ncbi:MAG: ribulose-phosphate 3-epimerase [Elusimicrobiales bacterium]|nr:ribulose-phosphate 3-epimerase [Elusimicrobiales bacterium]